MDTCPMCGAPAITKRMDGQYVQFERKDINETYYTVTERGQIVRGGALAIHVCDPERVAAYDGEEKDKAHAFNEVLSYALELRCPNGKCGAEPGFPCINLIDRAKSKMWPHDERMRAGYIASVKAKEEES